MFSSILHAFVGLERGSRRMLMGRVRLLLSGSRDRDLRRLEILSSTGGLLVRFLICVRSVRGVDGVVDVSCVFVAVLLFFGMMDWRSVLTKAYCRR